MTWFAFDESRVADDSPSAEQILIDRDDQTVAVSPTNATEARRRHLAHLWTCVDDETRVIIEMDQRGISQRTIAADLGLTQPSVSGRISRRIEKINRLADLPWISEARLREAMGAVYLRQANRDRRRLSRRDVAVGLAVVHRHQLVVAIEKALIMSIGAANYAWQRVQRGIADLPPGAGFQDVQDRVAMIAANIYAWSLPVLKHRRSGPGTVKVLPLPREGSIVHYTASDCTVVPAVVTRVVDLQTVDLDTVPRSDCGGCKLVGVAYARAGAGAGTDAARGRWTWPGHPSPDLTAARRRLIKVLGQPRVPSIGVGAGLGLGGEGSPDAAGRDHNPTTA